MLFSQVVAGTQSEHRGARRISGLLAQLINPLLSRRSSNAHAKEHCALGKLGFSVLRAETLDPTTRSSTQQPVALELARSAFPDSAAGAFLRGFAGWWLSSFDADAMRLRALRLPEKLDKSAVLDRLLAARRRILEAGWTREHVDEHGRSQAPTSGDPWTLWEAVQPPAASSGLMIHGWHARQVLQRIAGENLPAWNSHPHRTPHQVVQLLDQAIRALGGTPPRTRYRESRKGKRFGSWFVSVFTSPRGENRPISSQGSGASSVVAIPAPAFGAPLFSANGVPGMDNEKKNAAPASFGSMLELAATQPIDDLAKWVEQQARMTLELQRVLAERAKTEAPKFLGLDQASRELAQDLESRQYMFSTQSRVAKKLAAPAPSSGGPSHG